MLLDYEEIKDTLKLEWYNCFSEYKNSRYPKYTNYTKKVEQLIALFLNIVNSLKDASIIFLYPEGLNAKLS